MKLSLLAFFASLFLLSMLGCGLGNSMVGTWKLESAQTKPKEGFSIQITPPAMTAEFHADGTFTFKDEKGRKESGGIYEVKDGSLTMTLAGDEKSSSAQASISFTVELSSDKQSFDFPLFPGWKMVKQ